MLMKRTCPLCKSILTDSSNYFCEFCGEILPEKIQIKEKDYKNIREVRPVSKKKESFKNDYYKNSLAPLVSMRSVVVGIVLGIFISIFFFLFFKSDILHGVREKIFTQKSSVPNVNKNVVKPATEEVEDKEILEMGLSIASGNFGQYKIRDYVPYDTPLYLEFNDISTLEPYFSFLGGDFFTLTENLKGNTEMFYSAFYFVKGLKSGWVVLVYLKDENLEIREFSNIFTDRIDNILIISSDPAFIDDVKLAKSEVIKSISMHPVLISVANLLPKEGQIFILRTTNESDGITEELERATTSEEFKSVLKTFKDAEISYLVIK